MGQDGPSTPRDVDLCRVGAGQPRADLAPALLEGARRLGLPVAPPLVVVPASINTAGALVDAGDAEEGVRLS